MSLEELEIKVNALQKQLEKLEQKYEKRKKRENKASVDLENIKIDFIESNPKERTDPFTDFELVLYASLLYAENPRTKERINSLAELAKRSKKIKNIVNHFLEIAKKINIEKADDWARNKTREFIEYIILVVSEFEKDGAKQSITFYVLTSDWCINNFATKSADYSKYVSLKERDKPL